VEPDLVLNAGILDWEPTELVQDAAFQTLGLRDAKVEPRHSGREALATEGSGLGLGRA
jgi:hypothetical protein